MSKAEVRGIRDPLRLHVFKMEADGALELTGAEEFEVFRGGGEALPEGTGGWFQAYLARPGWEAWIRIYPLGELGS